MNTRISTYAAGVVVAFAACAFMLQSPRAQEHAGVYAPSDVAAGAAIFTAQCAVCHGLEGAAVTGVDMRRGQFRTVVTDEDLQRVITRGVPNAGMPAFNFEPPQLTALVAYIRVGIGQAPAGTQPVAVGDAKLGRAVFESAEAGCLTCHRVYGRGGRAGPDLSDIGASRTPAALQASIIDPSSVMHPINRPVTAVTADGRTIKGRRLNEDTYTVQLSTDSGELVSLDKDKLRRFEIATTSTMPSYKDRLSPEAIRNLVAYLATLRTLSPPATPVAAASLGGEVRR